jgi:hypothetical protein
LFRSAALNLVVTSANAWFFMLRQNSAVALATCSARTAGWVVPHASDGVGEILAISALK